MRRWLLLAVLCTFANAQDTLAPETPRISCNGVVWRSQCYVYAPKEYLEALRRSEADERDFVCMHANAAAIERDTEIGLCLLRFERTPVWKRVLTFHFHPHCGAL